MKEKRECKIIQDLLPNYIEKLTNEETNNYIEEHFKECLECKQVFEDLQKELNFNTTEKRDKREVKYIKKFNMRLKLLRNTLIVIIAIFVINISRKTIILTNLSNKGSTFQNENNVFANIISYNTNGEMNILKSYCKDGKYLRTINFYSEEKGIIKLTTFKSDNEEFTLIEDGNIKKISQRENLGEETSITPVAFTSENLLVNLYFAVTRSIDKVKLGGTECYMIKYGTFEEFVNVATGLPVKRIDNENNLIIDYHYEYGVVKDSDIVRPDTTEYVLQE